MKYYLLSFLIVFTLFFCSCSHRQKQVVSAVEILISVDSTADSIQDSLYLEMLSQKKCELEKQLNNVIGYAPYDMTVQKPECTMLNWACDALYDMAVEVYDGQVDFSVVNIGGMRCNWQAGNITPRHVFELMPFDNRLVILTMQGKDVLDLCEVYAKQGGQGFSRQMRMQIKNGRARNVLFKGKHINPEAVYYIATSDYLSGGADHFTPLTKAIEKIDTGIKIRDLYMQYVQKNDIVAAIIDGRMQQI